MTNVIDDLATPTKRDDVPDFRAGDTVKVHVKVVEGNRSRVQIFQGVVIRIQGSGVGRTFTVRKVSFGVGVERTFPLHSPIFEEIEIVTRRTSPRVTISISSKIGEWSGKVRSTPTPKETLRTVKVRPMPAPWMRITTPWKIWTRERVPSMTLTWTLTVSPARNSGRSSRFGRCRGR